MLASVHVRDQNGAVEVSVRTPDAGLSNSLQDGLPDLVRQLEAPGFTASATRGDSPAGHDSDPNTSQDGRPDGRESGRQDSRSGQDRRQHQEAEPRRSPSEQRRERLARWRESLGLAG